MHAEIHFKLLFTKYMLIVSLM